MWIQKKISISRPRGFHVITNEIIEAVPELKNVKIGMVNVFIQHTSASLTINENCDPDVRYIHCLNTQKRYGNNCQQTGIFKLIQVPETSTYFHSDEGPDDMPAHVKTSVFGCSLNIPISDGKLALG